IQARSAPAEKLLPAELSTITRTSSRAPRLSKAAVSSAIVSSLKVLWRSALLSATQATPRESIVVVTVLMAGPLGPLHAKHAEAGLVDFPVEAGGQRQPEHVPGIRGVDHAVIPEPGRGVVGVALPFVFAGDGVADSRLRLGIKGFALFFQLILFDLYQDAGRLLAPHYRDPGVGPHKQKAGIIGPAAHAVVAGAKRAADDYRQLGHLGTGHRSDQFGAVAGDTLGLVLAAHHKAGDVLQEHQGNFALGAKLDK